MRNSILTCLLFMLYIRQAEAQITNIPGPSGSGEFGKVITVLPNGNYVITDPLYDEAPFFDVGAAYLYNGKTHTLISTLKGSKTNDQVGSNGITVLANGNYVVSSRYWQNGSAANAGAVTWGSSITGVSGFVSSANSLVGTTAGDYIGFNGITVLSNGNYVVSSPTWHNGSNGFAGAVTWCNGTTGTSGIVSSSNSLVGSTAFDYIGGGSGGAMPFGGIVVLSNGNYVVQSPDWHYDGWAYNAGAVTWCNGATGKTGIVSSSNSLVGNKIQDLVGMVYPLSNGNYVVRSIDWSSAAGAVTWANGNTGITGIISSSNSLVGNAPNEGVGVIITRLNNGNYVVVSPRWAGNTGAVTWVNGTTGLTGFINSSNSLVGSTGNDQVGLNGVEVLSNGNYLVGSSSWDNGVISNVGAVTWGNGTTGITGVVSISNSLVGSSAGDQIGHAGVTVGKIALSNGNYVICSPNWTNGTISHAGAVTWGNGTTGITGVVSSSNSLVGSTMNDHIGSKGVTILSNGNYLVSSPEWSNGMTGNAGAVTWVNGSTGITGNVSSSNSLVGSNNNDAVGSDGITVLSNSNYIVKSRYWDNGTVTDAGAITWGNGNTGITGNINSSNSLVGSTNNDQIGSGGVVALNNGNFVSGSPNWSNGVIGNAGAVTWGNGSTGISGNVNSGNSLVGSTTNDYVGNITVLSNGNYVVNSPNWSNGIIRSTGAVTWGNGNTGITGIVSNSNSLVGNTSNDYVGSVMALSNGNYVVNSPDWNNGSTVDAGAITFGNGNIGIAGFITSCNSVMGAVTSGGSSLNFVYNYTYDYLITGQPKENKISIYNPVGMALANTLENVTTVITGNTPTPLIVNPGCRIIATLTPNGNNPVNGVVNAKVWIESIQPNNYVKRHYEITPQNNAGTSNGRVTLYFTQPEFDEFNAHISSESDLPTNEGDVTGKTNLRIGKYSGTSSNGTGLPGTYQGTAQVIDPVDNDIVWNSNLSRWEISFDVTGFSGFIVQTISTVIPLPLSLLEFKGHIVNNNGVLNWKTTDETNTFSFDIERSIDGRNYLKVGNVAAVNQPGIHKYQFIDSNIVSLDVSIIYYRLRLNDIDGHFSFSGIVVLPIANKQTLIVFYPNPANNQVNLSVSVTEPGPLNANIIDNIGRVIMQKQWNATRGINSFSLNVSTLTNGIYFLELKGQRINKRIQFMKE